MVGTRMIIGCSLTPLNSSTATRIRRRIEEGGERLWRFEDFPGLPVAAVPQALSRLTRRGELQRLSKGVYYRSRQTTVGRSVPNPSVIRQLAARRKSMFPAGVAAANLLGFTTQAARRTEVATNASSLPRKLVGGDTVIHTRRPDAWAGLSELEAALLDFLRRGGRTSELSPTGTVRRLDTLFRHPRRFERIVETAGTEGGTAQARRATCPTVRPPLLRPVRAGQATRDMLRSDEYAAIKLTGQVDSVTPRGAVTVGRTFTERGPRGGGPVSVAH